MDNLHEEFATKLAEVGLPAGSSVETLIQHHRGNAGTAAAFNALTEIQHTLKNLFVVVAINEDGDISVHGPYFNENDAEEKAEKIRVDDYSGNTIARVERLSAGL